MIPKYAALRSTRVRTSLLSKAVRNSEHDCGIRHAFVEGKVVLDRNTSEPIRDPCCLLADLSRSITSKRAALS
jgi:hypothetical protein